MGANQVRDPQLFQPKSWRPHHRSLWIMAVLLLVGAASCSSDDAAETENVDSATSPTGADAESDSGEDDAAQASDADESTATPGSAQGVDSTETAEENESRHADKLTFNDTTYIHRFSDGGMYEFTPEGQEDLSKWVDMLSINLYPGFEGEDALADIANRVLTSYTTNGAQVDQTDSVPRTEARPAEHLIVVTFNIPDVSESVRARFVLVGEECVGIIHSHRTYGESADEELEAWLEGDGAELDDRLMEWDEYPSIDELTASESNWKPYPTLDELTTGEADAVQAPSAIPVYITPLYNSEGPEINVGEFSDELEAATTETILDVATSMKTEWDTLPIEAMFVLAIRLYDFGHKDESVYWFYSAQLRFRVLHEILVEESVGGIGSRAFELTQASIAFMQLAGEHINGYGFGDLDMLRETLQLVTEEAETIPDFSTIYPEFEFIVKEEWQQKRAEVTANLQEMLDYINENEEFIREQRQLNGVEGKY
jgi:hypothetical protein